MWGLNLGPKIKNSKQHALPQPGAPYVLSSEEAAVDRRQEFMLMPTGETVTKQNL